MILYLFMLDKNFVVNAYIKPKNVKTLPLDMRFIASAQIDETQLQEYLDILQSTVDATLHGLNDKANEIAGKRFEN